MIDVTSSGILTTASDLLFTGGREGYFHALDARTGKLLWNFKLDAGGYATPSTYMVNGKQFVVIAAGGGGTSTIAEFPHPEPHAGLSND